MYSPVGHAEGQGHAEGHAEGLGNGRERVGQQGHAEGRALVVYHKIYDHEDNLLS